MVLIEFYIAREARVATEGLKMAFKNDQNSLLPNGGMFGLLRVVAHQSVKDFMLIFLTVTLEHVVGSL